MRMLSYNMNIIMCSRIMKKNRDVGVLSRLLILQSKETC